VSNVVRIAYLCVALGLAAGCDLFQDESPRQAWEDTMRVREQRDYATLWDSLASESHAHIEKVLSHVKRHPEYLAKMQEKFNLPANDVLAMDARAFFIALMVSVERTQPTIVNLQKQNAEGAQFIEARTERNRAVVSWRSGTGQKQQTFFIREEGLWKPVLQRD
jgi:hypothetical protein